MSEQRIESVPHLTAIAQLYRNPKCIAEEVLPRVKVDKTSFQYRIYNKSDYFSVPKTLIGEKGKANKIELTGNLVTETLEEHALEQDVAVRRIEESQIDNLNLTEKVTNQLADCLKIRKEVTLSTILSSTSNYGSNYKELEDEEKINLEDVNALQLVQDAIDEMLFKANRMVLSRKAASALRQNPYIVDAAGIAARKSGLVPIEALKELFELDKILIGESVMNTANKGQTVDLQACWQNDIILLHIDENADTEYGITFGYEAFYDDITIGTYFDGSLGTKGCDVYKAFYSNKYLPICPECGYLLKSVI